ncbi:hypothetical protein A3F07_02630 [candidate division WWE3 bacterium RIFCSPHIGHO2_12_FULL_38_15]|uniref:Ribulose-phosphate 3-epimerase n=1 Tax=candidate division WWE3 bacterium RIFCSPHIGHO2_02_FULL_38_14 TaxID=1802620 RepID=A0A1F4V6U6_UNCKA|nr:MAG: hypothetical protein A2793_02685 [candidate division WWE3 bacterium RIFCSPHIGHO2_01_FULL_38_45]OGC48722.1 MAG: hypothetical protein A3F07_02630 [candidate division WWE3 bacterium RIFCSPHIGHO2_12_FULL_38_15]OGC52647.1 MAG: hypothetical protein A3B64_03935 [candidate division WWE3 bacterium RIFCSPLOWO2_01_FULL_37_24]OGC52922.1 MAG: hypothetical protein A3D91_03140 [candidate division WWE3 bacterium RIFCSPHIGHO2_02_FULL_38_14]HLB51479.1 hypothetical protein [Patescibacteria group bacterium
MIIPGIFESDFEEIKRKIKLVDSAARLIQVDVADGELVDGKTFTDIYKLDGIDTMSKFDLDLMVQNPIKYLEKKVQKAEKISMLIDAEEYIEKFIETAKKLKYKVGLSLRPSTPVEKIEEYLDELDYVQFFTIRPGGSGREFQIEVLEKLEKFRTDYPSVPFQVDGGVDKDYLPLVLEAGAIDAVITSHIFNTQNPKEALEYFMGVYRNR